MLTRLGGIVKHPAEGILAMYKLCVLWDGSWTSGGQ